MESKQVLLQDRDVIWPYIHNLYSFFGRKSRKITVHSYGFDNGSMECEISEMTGCKVQIFDPRPEAKQRFDTVKRILTTHSLESTDPEYCSYFTKKWIKPDNLDFSPKFPWRYSGSMDLSGMSVVLEKKTVDDIPQIDLVKISLDGFSYDAINNILLAGYRPGLIFCRWDEHPDKNTQAMIVAAQLQNCGYRLLDSKENCFVYTFIDECIYEICSWNRTDVGNPMFEELKDGFLKPKFPPVQTSKQITEVKSNDVSPSTTTETSGSTIQVQKVLDGDISKNTTEGR